MLMDYFRRPQLAGNTLQRLPFGTVRGNLRRSDPDGTSSVPFFPGIADGDTLELSIDGTPHTVTFGGSPPTYQSILSDINAEISPDGIAFDADGTISIQSNGTGGSVRITGGTGAAAIGFDPVRSTFYSAAGDFPSTPEGRVGVPFGAAFPGRRENLTTESLSRALGRVMGNLDVLYSEHARRDGRMTKIDAASTTITTPAVGTSLITLPANTEVFTGLGILGSSPTPEDLAPFVQLIDPVTKMPPATCRVVGIVRGAVSGAPPYAPAPSFAGAGSIVNVDLTKATVSIENIIDGRIVQAPSGTDFTTNGTKVGDWCEIAGATNLSPWNNNGYRWIVEEVIDAQHVALRPMSQSEFAQANPSATPADSHPILELNGSISGIQNFGNLNIRSGTFVSGARLVVQPEIPVGALYDVWIAQPQSLRSANAGTGASLPYVVFNSTQTDAVQNDLISGFRVTSSPSSATIGAGFVRMHGRILRIPAATYTPATLGGDGAYYAYFDESTGKVEIDNTLPANSLSTDKTGVVTTAVMHPIARFSVVAGAFAAAKSLARYSTMALERITVGQGGDCATIEDAAEYASALAGAYNENDSLALYPHVELVLLHSLTAAGPLDFDCPSLSLRGATPLVKLGLTGSAQLVLRDAYYFSLSDLIIQQASAASPLIMVDAQLTTNVGVEIDLRRVRQAAGSVSSYVVQGQGGGQLKKLTVDDCSLPVNLGITAIDSPFSGSMQQKIYISRSYIPTISVGATPSMFESATGDWRGERISIRDSVFDGWAPASGNATSLMVRTSSSDGAEISVQGVTMTPGAFASGSNVLLIDADSSTRVFINGLTIKGEMPRIVSTSHPDSYIERCVAQVRPEGAGVSAVNCPTVRFCAFTGNLPATVRGTLVQASRHAIGNTISGEGDIGLLMPTAAAEAAFNVVTLTCGTAPNAIGISMPGANAKSYANIVTITATIASNADFVGTAFSMTGNGSSIEGCRAAVSGTYAFLGVADNSFSNQNISHCYFSNGVDAGSISLRRCLARIAHGMTIDHCRFESATTLPAMNVNTVSNLFGVFEARIDHCVASGELLQHFINGFGEFVTITNCKAASLCALAGQSFGGTVWGSQFTGNIRSNRSASFTKVAVGGNFELNLGSAGRVMLDTVTVTGNVTDITSSAAGDLYVRDCAFTGTFNANAIQLYSQRNKFTGAATLSGTRVYSSNDLFGGLTLTASSSLHVEGLEGGTVVVACPTAGVSSFLDVKVDNFTATNFIDLALAVFRASSVTLTGLGGAKAQLSGLNLLGSLQVSVASVGIRGSTVAGDTTFTSSSTSIRSSANTYSTLTCSGFTADFVSEGDTVSGAVSLQVVTSRIGGLSASSTVEIAIINTLTDKVFVSDSVVGSNLSLTTGGTSAGAFYFSDVVVGGTLTVGSAKAVSLVGVIVAGTVSAEFIANNQRWRIVACEFGSDLSLETTSPSLDHSLEISELRVVGNISINAFRRLTASNVRVGGDISTFGASFDSQSWFQVEVGGAITSSGGTFSGGSCNSITSSGVGTIVLHNMSVLTATLSNDLYATNTFFSTLTTSGNVGCVLRDCSVGFLAAVCGGFRATNSSFNAIDSSSPNLTISLSNFGTADFRNCSFNSEIRVTCLLRGKFSMHGGSLRGMNPINTSVTNHALHLRGYWDIVDICDVDVTLDNQARTTKRYCNGIQLNGDVSSVSGIPGDTGTIQSLKMSDVRFLVRPLTTGMVTYSGSGSVFSAWLLQMRAVFMGVITGCIFDRPRPQNEGTTILTYGSLSYAATLTNAVGVNLAGCQIFNTSYNISGGVTGRGIEGAYRNGAASPVSATDISNGGNANLSPSVSNIPYDAATA